MKSNHSDSNVKVQGLNDMAIARLTICDWQGVNKRDTEVDDPAWSDVESAIRALNNRNLNDVYLQPDRTDSETYLCVGGGAGRYIASGAVNNAAFPTLVDPLRSREPKVILMVGGQPGDYPSNWVVDLQSALRAAKSFYDAGGFSSDVNWVSV